VRASMFMGTVRLPNWVPGDEPVMPVKMI